MVDVHCVQNAGILLQHFVVGEELQKIVLKGEKPITCRPGELLPPADFAGAREHLKKIMGDMFKISRKDAEKLRETHEMKSNGDPTDRAVISWCLYPKVYEEFLQKRREYGYINARLNLKNKVVYGYWEDEDVQDEIAKWQDVAVAYNESFNIKVCRFGDTMRDVAVTEGDKVEAQIRLGWTVDYWPVGDLVPVINSVSEEDVQAVYDQLKEEYTMVAGDNTPEKFEHNVRVQIKEYLGIKRFLDKGGYTAFCTNFQDLCGMEQLPGLAAQLLMKEGYGFAAEGDWKTAALTRLMKIMAHNDRTVFMEDYTLDLRKGHEAILGAHMLEVDPTIASDKPRIEVHPLDIGDKEDPARLVFTGSEGDAVNLTVADFRGGFRLISYPVTCRKPEAETPHLPVAKQLWTPKVGLKKGATAWIHAGGGHHTVLSFRLTEEQIHDLAVMFDLDLVEIC